MYVPELLPHGRCVHSAAREAMALAHLFARCPVLPVDGTTSLARYLHTVDETRSAAAALERTGPDGDAERAAMLHVRVVQLVAKTLPAHPDRALPASAPVLARLERAGHASLDAFERILRSLAPDAETPVGATAGADVDGSGPVRVPAPLLDVFVNMVADRAGKRAVGVLAAREGARVVALVVPAQMDEGHDGGPVRYEEEIAALASHKGLVPLGVIVHAPTARRTRPSEAEQMFAVRVAGGKAVAVVVAPEANERVGSFEVDGEETRTSERVVFVKDELTFKVYDLRGLAKMKDEARAKAEEEEAARSSPPDS